MTARQVRWWTPFQSRRHVAEAAATRIAQRATVPVWVKNDCDGEQFDEADDKEKWRIYPPKQ